MLRFALLGDDSFYGIVKTDLQTGQHRNTTPNTFYFTDSYFHRTAEVRDELEAAGFDVEAQAAIEGLGLFAKNLEEIWTDERKQDRLFELLTLTEQLDEALGASSHIMTVGRRARKTG